MDDLFRSPTGAWHRVSPRLAALRRWLLLGWVAVAVVAAVVVLAVAGLLPPAWVLVLALLLVAAATASAWWGIGRNVARWGYAEEHEELLIVRGAVFRRLVVVPYGRMQYVDVAAGPLDQLVGIAKVHLHTASPGTTAVIPGLPADEAARLRDRLTALGESQAAGL
ncbi:PH domain-containing protein [Nocardioides caldifontis]|uniref:PH domain-containing protein n=1 Tax=Nocardioides caldifontis TaxID=2588938 RepID=UPI0011DF5200|nr:PH domain-containing protein [Nocardioides caldifontis]